MVSLTWNRRNPYADGAADDGGLSRLGRALVDRLVELGVILDLAHASPTLFADVLDRSGEAPCLSPTRPAERSTTTRGTSPTTSCERSRTATGCSG